MRVASLCDYVLCVGVCIGVRLFRVQPYLYLLVHIYSCFAFLSLSSFFLLSCALVFFLVFCSPFCVSFFPYFLNSRYYFFFFGLLGGGSLVAVLVSFLCLLFCFLSSDWARITSVAVLCRLRLGLFWAQSVYESVDTLTLFF